jgi:hypothetical protein
MDWAMDVYTPSDVIPVAQWIFLKQMFVADG